MIIQATVPPSMLVTMMIIICWEKDSLPPAVSEEKIMLKTIFITMPLRMLTMEVKISVIKQEKKKCCV